jgi:transcription elongation factor S-II
MASEERKAADNKIMQQNFHASLGAEEQQAETEAFQCGRCKQVCYPPSFKYTYVS